MSNLSSFNIIVSREKNYGIGYNNIIPWEYANELKYFRKVTIGNKNNAVIMGRNTWLSIPINNRPLEYRYNIVLSHTIDIDDNNILVCRSLKEALSECKIRKIEDVFIIGGEQIYNYALKNYNYLCKKIYVTEIDESYRCDTFFLHELNEYECKIINKNNKLTYKVYTPKTQEFIYLNTLRKILLEGNIRKNRTNINTFSLFGLSMKFNLQEEFPLLTTKYLPFKVILKELLFFIKGYTDNSILRSQNVNIWNKNTSKKFIASRNLEYKEGDMGPMYGFQWRHYGAQYKGCKYNYNNEGLDQLNRVIDMIKNDPFSRRIMMTIYNPSDLDKGVLEPCHGIIVHFYVNDDKLDCIMYQRSADMFLGVPFNIASYSLLVYMICNICDLKSGTLTIHLGDAHIYHTHNAQVLQQLGRSCYFLPKLRIKRKINNIDDFRLDDFELLDYNHHGRIKAEMVI